MPHPALPIGGPEVVLVVSIGVLVDPSLDVSSLDVALLDAEVLDAVLLVPAVVDGEEPLPSVSAAVEPSVPSSPPLGSLAQPASTTTHTHRPAPIDMRAILL
jgi:hypothetical protein